MVIECDADTEVDDAAIEIRIVDGSYDEHRPDECTRDDAVDHTDTYEQVDDTMDQHC